MAVKRGNIAIALSPAILVVGGVLWGVLWTSAVVAMIPYLYLVAPVPDIAAYGLVGIGVRRLFRSLDPLRSHEVILGALAMALFYIGNRVIWFGWALPGWPLHGFEPIWVLVVWEILVIFAGFVMATGLWDNRMQRRANP